MRFAFVLRAFLIAGAIAVACEVPGNFSAYLAVIACWGVCCIALMALPKRPIETVPAAVGQADLRGFLPWLACTGCFAAFVIVLAPWAELPAVPIGLLLLSPVFGMMVLAIESGLAAAFWRFLGR